MKKLYRGLLAAALLILLAAFLPCSAQGQTVDNLLWLVNPTHPLDQSHSPASTTNIARSIKATLSTMLMDSRAAQACIDMVNAMGQAGITDVKVTSAYRSYARQKTLYTNKVSHFKSLGYSDTQAQGRAAEVVLPPGQSEHQTGFSLDFTTNSMGGALNANFANTGAGKWLAAHAHEYGFILRYEKDKTDITKITYEPWHFRYVGTLHARIMKEYRLCLEEYLAYLKEAGGFQYQLPDGSFHEILYSTDLRSFDNNASLSQDNAGGYIFTRYVPNDPQTGGKAVLFDYELRSIILKGDLTAQLLLPGRPLYGALRSVYEAGFPAGWSKTFVASAPAGLEHAASRVAALLLGKESRWFTVTSS